MFGTQFFKNMVYSDPQWDYHAFVLDRDLKAADERMSGILNATNPDLSKFAARGGKLILYHGWSDAAIPALNAIDFYQSVLGKAGATQARSFVRLFMVPGMQHCGGGPGPNEFGQFGVAKGTPENNIDSALERWVEEGVAPEQIVAAKHENQANPASPVVGTHPLCAYPMVAQYKGSGSADTATNFVCAAEKGK
jgi:feruloyl esterase